MHDDSNEKEKKNHKQREKSVHEQSARAVTQIEIVFFYIKISREKANATESPRFITIRPNYRRVCDTLCLCINFLFA